MSRLAESEVTEPLCIAVPCPLVTRDGPWGEVVLGESRMKVRLDLVEEAEVGDWVIIHAGFAIERVDEGEARETLKMLAEVLDPGVPNPPAEEP